MIARPPHDASDPIEQLRALPDIPWRDDDRARVWASTCDASVRRSAPRRFAARAAAVLLVALLGGLAARPGARSEDERQLARIESNLERVMARVGSIVHRADTAAFDDVVAVGARLRAAPMPWAQPSNLDASP